MSKYPHQQPFNIPNPKRNRKENSWHKKTPYQKEARHGSNARQEQDLLDLLKIAHYSQLAFDKESELKNV